MNKNSSIVKTIIESSNQDIRTQIEYISMSFTEDDRCELYLYILETQALLINESTEQLNNIQIEEYSQYLQDKDHELNHIIEKLELAASILKPLSDHSIRGTIRFMKKHLPNNSNTK